MRDIELNEEMELTERALAAKQKLDAERLSLSFVEHLNEHQLYQSLWKGDEDGRVLMMVGTPAEDLAGEYDKDMFEITQEIYKLGLEKYEERQNEIDEFMSNLEEGHSEVQQMGHKIIEEFIQYKDSVFEELSACFKFVELRVMRGDDEETEESVEIADKIDKLNMEFEDMVNNVWQQLMSHELHLHETTEVNISGLAYI